MLNFLILLLTLFSNLTTVHANSAITTAVASVGDFVLLDHNGDIQKLYLNSNAKAIVIVGFGNSCPIVQKYSKKISELNEKYSKQGIVFFMIDPNTQDTRNLIIKEATKYGFDLPILLDPSQIVTRSLGLTRTSEAVIISPKNWEIIYRGAIDDRLGFEVDKQIAQNNYLSDALDRIIDGKPLEFKPAPAKGCAYTFLDEKKVISYTKTIAPLVQKKCLSCHGENGDYPPELNGYEKLRGWAAMIKETLYTDRMPPFSADPHYGKYSNDISITPEQKRLLVQWIDSGLPQDGKKDPLSKTPVINKVLALKKLGKPLYEVKMPFEQKIPPGGINEWSHYQLGDRIPHDMWIKAVYHESTAPIQLHHVAMMITSKPLAFYEKIANQKRSTLGIDYTQDVDGNIPLFVTGAMIKYEEKNNYNFLKFQLFSPNKAQPIKLLNNTYIFLPKDHYLILESHHVGTGQDGTEQSSVRFYGQLKKPKNSFQLAVRISSQEKFSIPAGVKKHIVYGNPYTLTEDIEIVEMQGHLHMRGRAAKLISTTPNGDSQIVASIPNFYYKWQTGASLQPSPPIKIEKGTKLIAQCEFDNSAANPNNPDPNKLILYGQTTDRSEMCIFRFVFKRMIAN